MIYCNHDLVCWFSFFLSIIFSNHDLILFLFAIISIMIGINHKQKMFMISPIMIKIRAFYLHTYTHAIFRPFPYVIILPIFESHFISLFMIIKRCIMHEFFNFTIWRVVCQALTQLLSVNMTNPFINWLQKIYKRVTWTRRQTAFLCLNVFTRTRFPAIVWWWVGTVSKPHLITSVTWLVTNWPAFPFCPPSINCVEKRTHNNKHYKCVSELQSYLTLLW